MKPTSNIHRLPATDSWQRQPQMKNTLMHRIKSMTGEIHSIQAEMHGELNEPANRGRLAKFFEDDNAIQVLNDFKAELDQFRRILWFYIEQASVQPTAAMDNQQPDQRLQRVNELFRALTPPAKSPIAGETLQPSISFFERLDVVMDTYMQEKKPVAQAKAKAAAAKAGY
jgi:hypothetical protein